MNVLTFPNIEKDINTSDYIDKGRGRPLIEKNAKSSVSESSRNSGEEHIKRWKAKAVEKVERKDAKMGKHGILRNY